jgi:hypothetical protein
MDDRLESRGLTRSGLIKAGTLAALAVGSGGAGAALARGAGIGAVAATSSGLGKPGRGPAYLERETYVPLVGSDFRVHRPGAGALRVKLIEARRLPSVGEAFSLHFRGHPGARVESGMHRLTHPSLGEFDLFLGPVGRGVKGLELEAVINRIAT